MRSGGSGAGTSPRPPEPPFAPFDREAERYDAWFRTERGSVLFRSELQAVRLVLEGLPGPYLEVGVGTGAFAEPLGVEYGVDPARGALRLAKGRGLAVVQGVGERLPFKDGSFGAVLVIVTLCFADDPLALFREARRVLRPEGALIVAEIVRHSPWGRFYEAKRAGGHPFYRQARFLTVRETRALLRWAGFEERASVSTLVQLPTEAARIEAPQRGVVRNAGFVCLRADPAPGRERQAPTD